MVPPAPSLFSITTVWPSVFDMAAPMDAAATPAAKSVLMASLIGVSSSGGASMLPYRTHARAALESQGRRAGNADRGPVLRAAAGGVRRRSGEGRDARRRRPAAQVAPAA